jgi:hypothetical protein
MKSYSEKYITPKSPMVSGKKLKCESRDKNMQWTVLFYAILSKSPALQAVCSYYVLTTGYKPVVMKISPFRTSGRTDLKSQIFITARSLTCGKQHEKNLLPVRQDNLKNGNTGSIHYSNYKSMNSDFSE